jgi:hypothetical protein
MHLRPHFGLGFVSVIVFGFVLLSSSAALAATTHYVNDTDPNGGGYSPPGTSCTDPGYPTITAAVAAAVSGDTIRVCDGTYTENVVLAKSLTLLGAQAGIDACGRVASESIFKPLIPTDGTLELRTGSAGSIINGFDFVGGTGLGSIRSSSGPIDALQILNNRIRGFTGNGVFLNDNGINITANQNEIDGTMKLGGGALFHLDTDNFDGFQFTNNCVVNGITGTGFFVDGNRNVDKSTPSARAPLFSGNFIDRNQTGVNLGSRAWGDGDITGNTFSNNLVDGLQGGPKGSLTTPLLISQNTFDSNGRSGLALTSFGNVLDPARGAQFNNITQNCFTGNGFLVPPTGAGISFSATQFPGTISTNVANQNNIFGNAIGARYFGPTATETINAENNWWGSPTGPTHINNPGGTGDPVVDNAPLPGGIDYVPFRATPAGGTPCIPTPPPSGKVTGGGQIDVVGGRANFGFNARQDGGVGSGHLNYQNHATGAQLNCTVTAVTMFTTTTAEFSGTCSADSTTPSFSAHVEDHGEPGAQNMDRFVITYGVVTEGGNIRSGNIQIHKKP